MFQQNDILQFSFIQVLTSPILINANGEEVRDELFNLNANSLLSDDTITSNFPPNLESELKIYFNKSSDVTLRKISFLISSFSSPISNNSFVLNSCNNSFLACENESLS